MESFLLSYTSCHLLECRTSWQCLKKSWRLQEWRLAKPLGWKGTQNLKPRENSQRPTFTPEHMTAAPAQMLLSLAQGADLGKTREERNCKQKQAYWSPLTFNCGTGHSILTDRGHLWSFVLWSPLEGEGHRRVQRSMSRVARHCCGLWEATVWKQHGITGCWTWELECLVAVFEGKLLLPYFVCKDNCRMNGGGHIPSTRPQR